MIHPNMKTRDFNVHLIKRAVELSLSEYHLEDYGFDLQVQYAIEGARMLMSAFMHGSLIEECVVRYPSDWWQACKERWFPAWLTHRYPVKYTERRLTTHLIYPPGYFPKGSNFVFRVAKPEEVQL